MKKLLNGLTKKKTKKLLAKKWLFHRKPKIIVQEFLVPSNVPTASEKVESNQSSVLLIKDLCSINGGLISPTSVKLSSMNFPDVKHRESWSGNELTYKTPNFIKLHTIITSVNILGYTKDHCPSGYSVTCIQDGQTKFFYCQPEYMVEVDEDSFEAKEQITKYKDFIRNNISSYLNNYKPQVGSDPEIFIENNKGEIIPAFKFLGSKTSKDNKTLDTPYGNMPLYWDGFQAEFETKPQGCLSYHVDSVYAGLCALLKAAKAYDKTARLSTRTVFDIPPNLLADSKEEHVQLGCMPSLNAYGLTSPVMDGRTMPFRSAGGHIHFGTGKLSPEKATELVKTLDAILGVACVALFAKHDDPRRRQYYGLPGEYRLPPHGLEYRSLSNAWLFHPLIMNLVFDVARRALALGNYGLRDMWQTTEEETIQCIIKCDVPKAQEILDRNKKLFIKILSAAYKLSGRTDKQMEKLYYAFYNGMDTIVKDTKAFESNWTMDYYIGHSDGKGRNVYSSIDTIEKNEKIA